MASLRRTPARPWNHSLASIPPPSAKSHQEGSEELFDILSCYFPISFSPPANDPHGITREGLARALADVLLCSPAFLPYLLPVLLEKLASSLRCTIAGACLSNQGPWGKGCLPRTLEISGCRTPPLARRRRKRRQAKTDALDLLRRVPGACSPADLDAHADWGEVWTRLRAEICLPEALEAPALGSAQDLATPAAQCLAEWVRRVMGDLVRGMGFAWLCMVPCSSVLCCMGRTFQPPSQPRALGSGRLSLNPGSSDHTRAGIAAQPGPARPGQLAGAGCCGAAGAAVPTGPRVNPGRPGAGQQAGAGRRAHLERGGLVGSSGREPVLMALATNAVYKACATPSHGALWPGAGA